MHICCKVAAKTGASSLKIVRVLRSSGSNN
jgi:hypothetical protein